jgi:cytochrome b561
MIGDRQRFTPLQRLVHWLMAVCILAMLFIGVGMVSTVKPKYLTLVSIHKPLGIAVFFALILLHVAALFHALVRRDGVFDAMAPVSTHHEVAPAE